MRRLSRLMQTALAAVLSPVLALFVESLQCTISGAIGGAADMPRARRAHQSGVNDPEPTCAVQNFCSAN